MCGILFAFNNIQGVNLKSFRDALLLQTNRGPDDFGILSVNANGNDYDVKNVKLNVNSSLISEMFIGHNRLTIIDKTKKSSQPVINMEIKKFLSYNGEFYNYQKYCNEITKNSDTLTLFHNLSCYGLDFMRNVNGMWAFIFGDLKKDLIYFSRDRYGKKPLYFYHDEHWTIASSEIKSIFHLLGGTRKVNHRSLAYFLISKTSPYLSNGETFYSDIQAIKPGETICLNLKKKKLYNLRKETFSSFDNSNLDIINLSDKELYQNIKIDMEDSIKLRLRSDVKIGIQLSGGVDSSMIAGVAVQLLNSNEEVNFYTCPIFKNDGNPTNDLIYSRYLAKELGINLIEIETDPNDEKKFFHLFSSITKSLEIPINPFLSVMPSFMISEQMNRDGVKVSLDGVGGDEILGGYPQHQSLAYANAVKGNYKKVLNLFKEWFLFNQPNPLEAIYFWISLSRRFLGSELPISSIKTLESYLKRFVKYSPILKNISNLSENYFVRDELTEIVDRQKFEINNFQLAYYLGINDGINMLNSVENRSPFLDPRLYKYLYISENNKFRNGFNKYALRKCLPSNIPNKLRWRKGKDGMRSSFSKSVLFNKKSEEMILESIIIKDLVDRKKLENEIKKSSYLFRSLYSLAVLEQNYKIYL